MRCFVTVIIRCFILCIILCGKADSLSLYFLLYYYAILQYAIRQGVVCVYEVMLCALCSSTLYYMVFMQFIAWYCNTTMFSIVLHCIALSCII